MRIYNEIRNYYYSDADCVRVSCVDVVGPKFWFLLNNDISDKYYPYKSNLSFIGLDYSLEKILHEILNFNNYRKLSNGDEVHILSCILPTYYHIVSEDKLSKVGYTDEDIEAVVKAILISTGYFEPGNKLERIVVEYHNNDILEFRAVIHDDFVDLYHIKDGEEEVIYKWGEFIGFGAIQYDICDFLADCDRLVFFDWDN